MSKILQPQVLKLFESSPIQGTDNNPLLLDLRFTTRYDVLQRLVQD